MGICVEHKGYILQQSNYNYHYMIFKADTEEWCMHCAYTKPLTEDEARDRIDLYIELISTRGLFEDE